MKKSFISVFLFLLLAVVMILITGCPFVKNKLPTATKVSGQEGNIDQNSSTFSWSGNDSDGTIAKYEYRKDGGAWTNHALNTSYNWNDYSEGPHKFEVRAQDNEGAYSNVVSWNFTYSPVVGMVLVEGGTFTMGDTWGDGYYDEKPTHEVTLTYDFYIGKYETIFDQYDAFCEATGRIKPDDEGWGSGTRPVIWVSWWEAIAYCNWLSVRCGLPVAYGLEGEANEGQLLDSSGNVTTDITEVVGYRLPTEAEWEYAARGGNKSNGHKYSGSDNVDNVAWYKDNSGNKTQEVGKKAPNELGIYDMSGNVWEWCSDWWYWYTETPKTNPYNSTACSARVGRGGGWGNDDDAGVRVAGRGSGSPTVTYNFLGFRICRTAP